MKKLVLVIVIIFAGIIARSESAYKCKAIRFIETADSTHKKIVHLKIAMSDGAFNAILSQIRRQRTDQEKIDVLKKGIKDKGITVDQITQLLNQLSTDAAKLSCAESAYPNTVNYKSYYDFENLLSNEDTKGQLEDFIKKNK
jgi:hypothetical protein